MKNQKIMRYIMKKEIILVLVQLVLANCLFAQKTSDTSDAVWSIVKPSISILDIDIGEMEIFKVKDSVFKQHIYNDGQNEVIIDNIILGGDGNDYNHFEIVSNNSFPLILKPGDSIDIEIRFKPIETKDYSAKLIMQFGACDFLDSLNISGSGVGPFIQVLSDLVDFGCVGIGRKDTLEVDVLRNIGSIPIDIISMPFFISNPNFTIIDSNLPATLNANDAHKIKVEYAPTAFGSEMAVIEVNYSVAGSPEYIRLYGAGDATKIYAVEQMIFNDKLCPNDVKDTIINIRNLSFCNDLEIYDIWLDDSTDFEILDDLISYPIELISDSSIDIPIRWHPTIEGANFGEISIESNADSNAINGVTKIQLTGSLYELSDFFELSNNDLDFLEIEENSSKTMDLEIRNVSNKEIEFSNSNLHFLNGSQFTIIEPALPFTIPGNSTQTFKLEFTARDTLLQFDTLIVRIDEPCTFMDSVSVSGRGSSAPDTIRKPEIIGIDTLCANTLESYVAKNKNGKYYEWSVTGGIIEGVNNDAIVNILWGTDGIGIVKLIETDIPTGIIDSTEKEVSIKPIPKAEIIEITNEYLVGTPPPEVVKWHWYYNNLNQNGFKETTTELTTSNTFYPEATEQGLYYLVAENEWGCSDTSSGKWYPPDSSAIIIATDSLYFLLPCISEKVDSIMIQNQGQDTLEITSISLSANPNFSILAPPTGSIFINPADNIFIAIKYNAGLPNLATLTIENNSKNSPILSIPLKGDFIRYTITEIYPDTKLDFNPSVVGDKDTITIRVADSGSISPEFILHSKGNQPKSEYGSDVFDVNLEELIITVEIDSLPQEPYPAVAFYELIETYCKDTTILRFDAYGPVIKAMAILQVGSSIQEHKPGDKVTIPIILVEEENLDEANVSGFIVDLEFNASLLVPDASTTPIGRRVDDVRYIDSLLLPRHAIHDNILRDLNFIATLGNDTSTVLTINNQRAISTEQVEVQKFDGRFSLAGVCMEDGIPRLLDMSAKADISLLRPNPTENRLTIEYEVIENGFTEMYIVNTFGIRLKTIISSEMKVGKYSIETVLNDYSSGMYYIILETPTIRKTEKVEVVK